MTVICDRTDKLIFQKRRYDTCQSKHTPPKPGAQSSGRTIRAHNRPAATRLFTTQPSPWQQGQIASTSGSDFSSCERKKKWGEKEIYVLRQKKRQIFSAMQSRKKAEGWVTVKRGWEMHFVCLFACYFPSNRMEAIFHTSVSYENRTEPCWSSGKLTHFVCLSRFS